MTNALTTIDAFSGDDDFKDMSPQDQIISRMMLMQFGSKPVKQDVARPGSWINSGTMETVATKDQTFKVVPLIYWKKWVEWNPIKGAPKGTGPGKMILNQTSDPTSQIALAANSMPRQMKASRRPSTRNTLCTYVLRRQSLAIARRCSPLSSAVVATRSARNGSIVSSSSVSHTPKLV